MPQALVRLSHGVQLARLRRPRAVQLLARQHSRSVGLLSSAARAYNLAVSLVELERFDEAKSVLRKTIPMAQRILGLGDQITRTLKIRGLFAEALSKDPAATLDDLHEAVTTLEDVQRIARRMLGGAHPTTERIADELQDARAALRARETPSPPG